MVAKEDFDEEFERVLKHLDYAIDSDRDEAIALLRGLRLAALSPTWTTTRPTEEGWYRYRLDKLDGWYMAYVRSSRLLGTLMVAVYDNRRIDATPDFTTHKLCDMHGEWSGPIREPE